MPESSFLRTIFEQALRDYEKQTETNLDGDPFIATLAECDSVESITAAFEERAQAFRKLQGKDGKVMKCLKGVINVLYPLSSVLGAIVGIVRQNPVMPSLVLGN